MVPFGSFSWFAFSVTRFYFKVIKSLHWICSSLGQIRHFPLPLNLIILSSSSSRCTTEASMEAISQYISKLFRTTGKRAKQSLLLPEGLCRRFSLAEIKIATNNFDEDSVIGEGAFGKIYKGFIGDCTVSVAIKRKSSTSRQGFEEFGTEILLLCQLRHPNLVNLIDILLTNRRWS